MDEESDPYIIVENSSEFKLEHPGRLVYGRFRRLYKVKLLSLHLPLYKKCLELIERDHLRYDIMCANLNVGTKKSAKNNFLDLALLRMDIGLSVVALEIETQRVLAVVVATDGHTDDELEPQYLQLPYVDIDVHHMETYRNNVLKLGLKKKRGSHYVVERGHYLEINLICGSRGTSNYFDIETRLIRIMYHVSMLVNVKSLIVITDRYKLQQYLKKEGFVNIGAVAYSTINRSLKKIVFSKIAFNTTLMCLYKRVGTVEKYLPRQMYFG